MAAITKEQIKRIYVLGSSLGMVDRQNPDDMLHTLVCALTGKESIRSLDEAEFEKVQADLLNRMRLANRPVLSPRKKPAKAAAPVQPGSMTTAQQSMAWRLIYKLAELDPESTATAGQRMRGAIKKVLEMDTELKEPFRWVTAEQGHKLIETLKRYVRSAQRKVGVTSAEGSPGRTHAR